jgi:trans-aconitate methyltransferase
VANKRLLSRVPPNCAFQIDDIESDWDVTHPFDYIHMRAMAGSIRDWDRLMEQAMTSLLPNGWLEVQEFAVWIYADDGSMDRAPTVRRWQENLIEASKLFGKPMNVVDQHRSRMEAAGFVDVTEDVYKVRARLR